MVPGPYYRKPCDESISGQEFNRLVEKYSTIYSYYKDGYLYIAYYYSDNPKEIESDWEPLTIQQMYDYLGDPNDFEITYEDAYPNPDPQPEPTPQPTDPTISQLTELIVETSVNVDYLVSLQSFQ